MKFLVLISFFFLSAHCFGQKWHLNTYNTSQEHPYQYSFQFENLNDTCAYRLQTKSGYGVSTISLFDNEAIPIIATHIRIEDLEKDSIINFTSNFEGKADCPLEKGRYKIHILTVSYDRFELEFKIETEQFIELAVYLGLAPELSIYQINSKNKLTDDAITEIMDCVRNSRQDFSQLCSIKEEYEVVMQI